MTKNEVEQLMFSKPPQSGNESLTGLRNASAKVFSEASELASHAIVMFLRSQATHCYKPERRLKVTLDIVDVPKKRYLLDHIKLTDDGNDFIAFFQLSPYNNNLLGVKGKYFRDITSNMYNLMTSITLNINR